MAKTPHIEEILDRQVRSWELRRKLAGEGGEAARKALVHLQEGPWLTVSREWGSGGIEIARQVGRELDWQIYDRELLAELGKQTRTREAILSRLEQRVIGPLSDLVSQLIAGDPNRLGYVKEMTQVVWGLAKQGQAVIVGRGANWYLDPDYGLRVRFVAPLDRRVARVAEEEGLDADAARRKTEDHDAQRRSFIQQLFGRSIDDPLGYDLVINTEAIDRDTAAQVVLTALRRKLAEGS